MTYQVSAWIRIGSGSKTPQTVNIGVNVDGNWFDGGYIEIDDNNKWHEISGSSRIENQPKKVTVYVQGPNPGVDVMVAGLQIFGVDRRARFSSLRKETDKVRKRDVILKFTGSSKGTKINIKQLRNSFPIGSCVSRSSIDNEKFVAFFRKHFSWSVFENELKWYHTEPQQGQLNYKDADDLLNFCASHRIQVRGHCIFWEDPKAVQQWVQNLDRNALAAVQNRLTGWCKKIYF